MVKCLSNQMWEVPVAKNLDVTLYLPTCIDRRSKLCFTPHEGYTEPGLMKPN